MTTIEITQPLKLTILKHLASGKTADVVATIVKLPRDRVVDIASHHGYPDTEKLAWAADILAKKIEDSDKDASITERPDLTRTLRTQTAGAATSTPAAPAPSTRPDEIRILLNTAKAHPSKRIQAAADRVFDQLDRVRALLREDQEKHAEKRAAAAAKAAARAEVERLEAQLAAAKAKLRGTPATKAAAGAATDGPTAAEVRAWAAANHIDCPATGRVPGTVRDQYDAAHTDQALAS